MRRFQCVVRAFTFASFVPIGAALAGPAVEFAPFQALPAGDGTLAVAIGDINGDGAPDVIASNQEAGHLSIYLNDGAGGLVGPTDLHLVHHIHDVLVLDVDGDGVPDLLTANWDHHSVALLRGNGDGTFQSPVFYPVGLRPWKIAIGDYNRDGWPDIAVVNSGGAGDVSVLLNDQNGGFLSEQRYGAGSMPRAIVAADFDRDGALDLAVANTADATVSFLWGVGDGTFTPGIFPVVVPVGAGAWSLAVGDFDRDGRLDVACANRDANSVSIIRNTGPRTFAVAQTLQTGNQPWSVVAADFDNDGAIDLATGNATHDTVSILRNDGAGVFTRVANLPAASRPRYIAAGDLDRDGDADIVCASFLADSVSVLRNLRHTLASCPGDVTGDGVIDFADFSAVLGVYGEACE